MSNDYPVYKITLNLEVPEEAIEKAAIRVAGVFAGDEGQWRGYWNFARAAAETAAPLIVAAELDRLAHGLHECALADRVRALDAKDSVSRATYKHRADGYVDASDALRARASVLRGEGDPKEMSGE